MIFNKSFRGHRSLWAMSFFAQQDTFIFINSESNFMPAGVCGIVMRRSYFPVPIETDFRGCESCRRNAANYARTTKMRKGFVIEIIV